MHVFSIEGFLAKSSIPEPSWNFSGNLFVLQGGVAYHTYVQTAETTKTQWEEERKKTELEMNELKPRVEFLRSECASFCARKLKYGCEFFCAEWRAYQEPSSSFNYPS